MSAHLVVLDTNVLSELTRTRPDPGVLAWLDALPFAEVATTAVTAAELHYGVERLPDGRRKTALRSAVDGLLWEDLAGRIEPFDAVAAARYSVVVAARERAGRPISMADAQIAAICHTRGARLATRNIKEFTDTGIDVLNPWDAPERA